MKKPSQDIVYIDMDQKGRCLVSFKKGEPKRPLFLCTPQQIKLVADILKEASIDFLKRAAKAPSKKPKRKRPDG